MAEEIIVLRCPKCKSESEYGTEATMVGEEFDVECDCGHSFVARIKGAIFYAESVSDDDSSRVFRLEDLKILGEQSEA